MGSELDRELRKIMERLTSPRSPFERATVVRQGIELDSFRHAPQTLPELFERGCRRYADREMLIDGEHRLTFRQVHSLALRVAAALADDHGVGAGTNVGIAAANSANWVIAYMGVLIAGGCATLLNAWWVGNELRDGIDLADCTLVLADAERAERIGAECSARVVRIADGDPETGLADILAPPGSHVRAIDVGPEDPATILFTSGSTAKAKAAWSDHRALCQATANFAIQNFMLLARESDDPEDFAKREVALLCLPLFHVTGEIPVLLQSIAVGRKVVIMPRWNALEAMRLIEAERVTFFVGVPLMSFEMAMHPKRAGFDLSSCRSFAAGGSSSPASHVGQIRRAMPHGFPMMGYGLTETNCVGATNFNENYLEKPHSTGPASTPLVEIAIFADDGSHAATGEHGEVAIRSVCNFRGYWNDPDATAKAIRPDGFFLTGDIGYLDADSYLTIVDRKKNIIIRGGENISCSEVEAAIHTHPGIAEACVFGMPDAHFGEVPIAVYTTRPDCQVSAEELRAHLVGRLATFKVPVTFRQEADPLPRLGTQKIDRVSLKARYSQRDEAARTAA